MVVRKQGGRQATRRWRRRVGAGDGIAIDADKIVTNIVIFDISGTGKTSAEIVEALAGHGILATGFGSLIRMVTHLDITHDDITETIKMVRKLVDSQ